MQNLAEDLNSLDLMEERFQELSKIIPLNCNIVSGIIGEDLEIDLVGTLRHENGDIVAQPPFMKVPIIIDHYWFAAESGAVFVVNYGKENQISWKRENNKWVEDFSVPKNNSRKRKIITLSDIR